MAEWHTGAWEKANALHCPSGASFRVSTTRERKLETGTILGGRSNISETPSSQCFEALPFSSRSWNASRWRWTRPVEQSARGIAGWELYDHG
jgi:hypothetical protein